ncbi:MAG: ribosomal subunit interface protein, partial [Candidatus Aminicenantes bacterium]
KERRKLIQKRRRAASREVTGAGTELEEAPLKLIRLPFFSDKPISLQEALLELEEGKKEVFMFRKEGSESWAAVFRRKDGQIGLVDPEG